MGVFKFSMTLLKKEFDKSIIFMLTMLFSIAVSLVFFDIINNPYLQDTTKATGGASFQTMQLPFAATLSFIIIIFCGFMIFFANNFYLSKKTGEIAILSMSGLSTFQSTLYLLYQTFALVLIALPLGLIIGQGMVFLMHYGIYQYMHIEASIIDTVFLSYLQTIFFVVMMMVLLCVLESGFIFRHDIQTLLMENEEMEAKDHRILRIPYVLYGVFYILGMVMMFSDHQGTSYIVPTCIGVFGSIGMIRYVLPQIARRLKKGPLLTKKYALIYISNLSQSIQQANILIALLIGSVTSIMTVLMVCMDSYREFVVSIMGYVVIIILLTVSIVYKFVMEASMRKTLYFNLWKVGYTVRELKTIIAREVFCFYLSLIVIPLPYLLIILGRFIYFNGVSITFASTMMLFYLVPLILSAFVTYRQYHRAVITQKEG